MQMDTATFERVADDFAAFHQHFAPYFGRSEARRRSEQYLRSLLLQHADRRNAENLAEALPGATPRALQRFLTEGPGATAPIIDALQQYLAPRSRRGRAQGRDLRDQSGARAAAPAAGPPARPPRQRLGHGGRVVWAWRGV